jgi:hypothetical protein
MHVVRDPRRGAVTFTAVVHASSSENSSYPLCRARGFERVTMCVENVTCERCIVMLGERESPGTSAADSGIDARMATGRA